MSADTIKTLAIGLISPPSRVRHHEALLASALRTALAAYSALQPCLTAESVNAEGIAGSDELGAYAEFQVPLSTGVVYATQVTLGGEGYRHRLISCGPSNASVRVYGALAGTRALTIWRPGPHDPAVPTWPPHHEALIALMTASFYLNALSLQETDPTRADLIQSLAAAYYGRAATTLQM